MDSQYSPMRSAWEGEGYWQHTDYHPVSFSPPSHQFIADPLPFNNTSVISSTPKAPLYLGGFATSCHGLPIPPQSPTVAANNYEAPNQWHNQTFLQPSPFPASRQTLTEVTSNPSNAQSLSKKQLQRKRDLEDELYPLKLIRELHRISGKLPRVSKGGPYFEVIHINDSIHNGLTVENVSTYTTVQAANDRVLDFWDQKYGTRMFTNALPSFETGIMPMNFEHAKEPGRHSYPVLPREELNYRSSGGVTVNNSYWAINNKCLSLSHKSGHGEKRLYVSISYMRDQGIHI
ncbi:hypothetical protein GGR58DRAFT_431870 [Xylaria digitata]|nr:hypothetical protein GGR58DRAFT_431870 [Xylaria digitata]